MATTEKPAAQPGTDVAMVKARLPWHSRFEEEFKDLNVTKGSWRTLVEAIWPSAKSVEAVQMALSYCKARKLDPFKRPVHIVPMYSSVLKAMVETVWPGISELRTTAARTSTYAGTDVTEFGPTIKRSFKNEDGAEIEVEFPEWARITIYRMVLNNKMSFPGPMVRWMETYATESRKSDWPNAMWRKRPWGQIEKCAEAASLRKAFPEELQGDISAEEMEGQHNYAGGGIVIEHEQDTNQFPEGKGPPKGPPPVRGVEHKPEPEVTPIVEQERERDPEPVGQQDEDIPQAEEVTEQERKPEPVKKGADKKPAANKKKDAPPADDIEGEFATIVKSLQVAMKQAKDSDDEKPVFDWITASKDDRKALMVKDSRIETRLKQLIAIVYDNVLAGPEKLEPFLKDGETE